MIFEELKKAIMDESPLYSKIFASQKKVSKKAYDFFVNNDCLKGLSYNEEKMFDDIFSPLIFSTPITKNANPFFVFNDVTSNGEKTMVMFTCKDALKKYKQENDNCESIYLSYKGLQALVEHFQLDGVLIYTSVDKTNGFVGMRIARKNFETLKIVERMRFLLANPMTYYPKFLNQKDRVERFLSLNELEEASFEGNLEKSEILSNLIFAVPLYNKNFMRNKVLDGELVEENIKDLFVIPTKEDLDMYKKTLKKFKKSISFVYMNFNDISMLYKYLDCEYCSLFLPSFSRERPLMLNGKFLEEITNAYMEYNYDVEADFSAKPVINSYVKGAKLVQKQFRKNYKIRKAWVVNCMETKQNGKHYKYEVMIVQCKLPDFYEMYRDLKCIFEKTNPELARIIYYESGLGKILLEKKDVKVIL